MFHASDAKQRRRFYLERSARKRPSGAGSDLAFLMALERTALPVQPAELFGNLPVLVVGDVATRAYAPERTTKDIDFLVQPHDYETARQCLKANGFAKRGNLRFPNTMLGLYGEAWANGPLEIELLSSQQPWAHEAFEGRVNDQTGVRVIPLAYLVLMKYESARSSDMADIERMLAPLSESATEQIIAVVKQHVDDPDVTEELRQLRLIGIAEVAAVRAVEPEIGTGYAVGAEVLD